MAWDIVGHVCRLCCGGRILHRVKKKRDVFHCAGCGEEKEELKELCFCGASRKSGLRCVKNASQTPEFPTEIVVRYSED